MSFASPDEIIAVVNAIHDCISAFVSAYDNFRSRIYICECVENAEDNLKRPLDFEKVISDHVLTWGEYKELCEQDLEEITALCERVERLLSVRVKLTLTAANINAGMAKSTGAHDAWDWDFNKRNCSQDEWCSPTEQGCDFLSAMEHFSFLLNAQNFLTQLKWETYVKPLEAEPGMSAPSIVIRGSLVIHEDDVIFVRDTTTVECVRALDFLASRVPPPEPPRSPEGKSQTQNNNEVLGADSDPAKDTLKNEGWLKVSEAAKRLCDQIDNTISFTSAKARVSKACNTGILTCKGKGIQRRIEPDSLDSFILKIRNKALEEDMT